MERLTRRTKLGAAVPYIDLSCESEYNDWITDITEKLAEYEDLEEQGLLLRLPCKVGDTVWCVEEDDYSGMVFMSMCGNYVIASSQYAHLKGAFDVQIKEMALESKENYGVETYIFHKDDVFLTKEEAEAKLREMEVGE